MGELHYINQRTQELYESGAIQPIYPIVPRGFTLQSVPLAEDLIVPSPSKEQTIIEDVADDSDLVAYVELTLTGDTEVDMTETRKGVIEQIGLAGIREDIIQETGISPEDFGIAYAMCQEKIRERYGLDEQDHYNNW